MIEFACPGCTKNYEANRAFVGFETRCLRCGTQIRIPANSEATPTIISSNGLPAAPKPSARRPAAAPPRHQVAAIDLDLGPDLSNGPATATATAAAPLRRRPLPAESAPEMSVSNAPEPVAEAPVQSIANSDRTRKKKQKIIGGSVVGVLVVAALLAIAFSGKTPKPAPKPDTQPPPPAPKQEPPAVKPPEPKPVAVYETAPMPRAVRPPVEYELTAAALLLEYGEGPAACDQKYAGKDLLVRGVFHHYRLGKLAIVATDEKSTPIAFSLRPPTELRPGELLPDPGLTPGQAVVVRGTYGVGCRFTEATVEAPDSAADRAFLGKPISLEGATIRAVNAPTGSVPFPTLVLEPPATDSKIAVTCYFKSSALEEILRLKAGMRLDVRGRCSGRSYTSVRLDNCILGTPDDPPGTDSVRVSSAAFFYDYESDLLASPRVNLKNPAVELLPVTAEGLGHAYHIDPRSANASFRNKAVQLSGIVKERHASTRMLVLQCGTDTAYSVAVIFSPAEFALVPEADKSIVVRGVCSGLAAGYIRIESAEYAETEAGTLRTEVDFLPYRLGKEHIVDQIAPGRVKDSPIMRSAIRFAGDDLIQVVHLKHGSFPGTSLFKEPLPDSKWYNSSMLRSVPQVRRYRVRDGVVEIGQPFLASGSKKDVQEFWEPVIKAGLKKGQSWSARFPDGKMATYTVMGFAKTASNADQLEIKRTLRDPLDPTRWEENGITYVRGVGEVRRIVSFRTERGEAVVTAESRLVSDGSPMAELKSQPSPEPKKSP